MLATENSREDRRKIQSKEIDKSVKRLKYK